MRAKRIIAISFVIAILLVVVYLLRYLGNPHRVLNTAGEVVYSSDIGSPGKPHLFIVHADGTGLHQLTRGNESDIQPSFSPDGSQIVFMSDRSGSPQVYLMDADGDNMHAVTVGTDSKSSPQFAPDGQRIGYITRGQLAVTDVNGGGTDLLLPVANEQSIQNSEDQSDVGRSPVLDFRWQPSADPSKSQIAAIQEDAQTNLQIIALVNPSGGKPAAIFEAPTITVNWSLDGAKLAVAALGLPAQGGHTISAIVLFNSDGSPVQQPPIVAVPSASAGPQDPVFLPDGQRIAYTFVVVNKLGSTVSRGIGVSLLTPGGAMQPPLYTKPASEARFSPDGANGLFLTAPSPGQQNRVLNIASLSTGVAKPISDVNGDVSSASWSPALAEASQ